jgi:hypothetical protein
LLGGLLSAVGAERAVRPSVQVIVVAEQRRGAAAVAELGAALNQRGLPVAVAGWIALDRKGLHRWVGGDRGAGRSILLRSARPVVEQIASADAEVRAARGTNQTVDEKRVSVHAG